MVSKELNVVFKQALFVKPLFNTAYCVLLDSV